MEALTLFEFLFDTEWDQHKADLLRQATGMRVTPGTDSHYREPGRGSITDNASLHLYEGKEPNSWGLAALGSPSRPIDRAAVAACRQRILEVMPQIASSWRELAPPADLRGPGDS